MEPAPTPSRCYRTTLIPLAETVSWKITNVSHLLQTNAWPAMSIPMEVGLGATDLSRWTISLVARNKNKVLCARTMLLAPQEPHTRVSHTLRVAVVDNSEDSSSSGALYYFPNNTNRNAGTTTSENLTNNDNDNRCFRNLRRAFLKNSKLDEEQDDELGDGTRAKEARPGHKGHPTVWKVIPMKNIEPDQDDCIQLRVTLTVFGCDSVVE